MVAAHGLRGLLCVRAYHPPAPSLAATRRVFLEHRGERRAVVLTRVTPFTRGRLLVSVEGIADRTAAEALAGARILVAVADLPPTGPEEFYYHEVVGFTVETVHGRVLGTIAGTMPTGLNDVWIVRDGAREHLIPVIADVVRTIDRAARRIVIDPLPGLLH